jgi:2-iminobutanoate/2-iminopropanoate deaminase
MKSIVIAAIALYALPGVALAAPSKHFAGAPNAAYSAALEQGNTLYISGTADGRDPDTGKPPADAKRGAKVVLDNVQKILQQAGYTMDDLVWVQIFATDLKDYADFNTIYKTYFKGPLPARAFIGAGSLLGNAHFEVMGMAVKGSASRQ